MTGLAILFSFLSAMLVVMGVGRLIACIDWTLYQPPTGIAELVAEKTVWKLAYPAVEFVATAALQVRSSSLGAWGLGYLDRILHGAGRPFGLKPEHLFAEQLMTGCVLALLAPAVLMVIDASEPLYYLAIPGSFILGAFIPLVDLVTSSGERAEDIVHRMPYAIDLLVLSLGAGSTFDEAVESLVAAGRDDRLTKEFRSYLQDVERGLTHHEALMRLGDRTGVNRVQVLVQAILQGERLGVPIVTVLKRESTVYRDIRMNQAEERGRTTTAKLLAGPILVVFLCVFVLMVGPFVVNLTQATR